MAMRSLTYDIQHYHKAFNVYHRVADRENVLGTWISTTLPEIVRSMEVSLSDDKDALRVLSVGPGDGALENIVLKVLREREEPHRGIHATVVEPAPDMIKKYKERVATEAAERTTYDWKMETLDEYRESVASSGVKFHFISSLHSIYYVNDLRVSIKDLYNRLEPGGMLLIIIVMDESGLGRVWKRFPLLRDEQYHPTSAEIEAACKEEDIPIADDFIIKVRSNITDCFKDPKDMTEDGRLLLDFIPHVTNFLGEASPELQTEFLEFLGSDNCSEKIEGGQVYFKGDWKAFIVRR